MVRLSGGRSKYFGIAGFDVPFSFGHAGVELFFVLSGFIIVTVHWKDVGHPSRLADYLKKRAVRIYPVYWLVFLPVLAAALAIPSLRDGVPHDFATLAKGLLLLPQNPAVVGGTGAPVLIVAWSLQYELYFYALVALAILDRRLGLILAVAVVALYLFKPFGAGFPWAFLQADWMLLFAMGVVVAFLHRRMRRLPHPLWFAAAGFILFMGTGLYELARGEGEQAALRLAYGAGSALMILGLVRAEAAGEAQGLAPGWACKLGDASYVLYLLHFPIISLCCKIAVAVGLTGMAGAAVAFIAIFAVCILAALAFHRLVEKPILGWCHRHLIAGTRPPTAVENRPA